jgi:hypothetical protein
MKELDAILPVYEFRERHRVTADASPERLDRALREVTFGELPLVRALLWLRGIGRPANDEPVLAAMKRRGDVVDDIPGQGIVLAVRGQFWRLRGGRGPGADAVALVDFRADAGFLSTETRVHVADPVARRKFARYWRVIRPFSGLTRILLLRAAKRRAESRA